MRAPTPSIPSGLPGRTAITIIGCLVVALAALWFYVLTRNMMAIGVGLLALVVAGVCASTSMGGVIAATAGSRPRRFIPDG